jgi:hypothetical protein
MPSATFASDKIGKLPCVAARTNWGYTDRVLNVAVPAPHGPTHGWYEHNHELEVHYAAPPRWLEDPQG